MEIDNIDEFLTSVVGKSKKMSKRNKSNTQINNKPTVEFTDSPLAKEIEFSDLKSRKKDKSEEDVFKWKPIDAILYMGEKYRNKFFTSLGYRINAGLYAVVYRIHDKLLDRLGHCDMLVLKDYFNYIFAYEIDGIIKKNKGKFYVVSIEDSKYINSFCENYDYKSSFNKEIGNKKRNTVVEEISKNILTTEKLYSSYLLNQVKFVCDYGILISVYWLIKQYHLSKIDALKSIYLICKKIYDQGKFDQVIKATKSYSPYPVFMECPELDKFIKDFNNNAEIEIGYTDKVNLEILKT